MVPDDKRKKQLSKAAFVYFDMLISSARIANGNIKMHSRIIFYHLLTLPPVASVVTVGAAPHARKMSQICFVAGVISSPLPRIPEFFPILQK